MPDVYIANHQSNKFTGQDGWIGKKAREVYKSGDPESVGGTISLKLFEAQHSVCKAEDFR